MMVAVLQNNREYGPNGDNSSNFELFEVLTNTRFHVNTPVSPEFIDPVCAGPLSDRESLNLLTPGRYVGAEDVVDDGEPFDEKMGEQFAESDRLEKVIRENLAGLGYRL